MQIKINNVTVNYILEGPIDAPCVTFCHSLACNLHMWDEQVKLLCDRYQVLCYDIRGHGGSQATEGKYNFDMLVDDVVALWDGLGIKQSHWIGLSLGGMIGFGLAIRCPTRILSMTACDTRADASPAYADLFAGRIRSTREQGMEAMVEPTITRWFTEKSLAEKLPAIEKISDMIRGTNPQGHIGCCEAIRNLSYGANLGDIKAPTLVLVGAEDVGAPPDVMWKIHEAIPSSQYVVIPFAGHISNIENPIAFNVAIDEFLAGQK